MSKPKKIRSCAFCGLQQEKSNLLRINLPDLTFDFFQNKNFRSFYICQNISCINKVLKKYAVNKHLDKAYESLEGVILKNIKDTLSYYKNEYSCKNIAVEKRLLNYKNIITYLDGFNGELNGSKKS